MSFVTATGTGAQRSVATFERARVSSRSWAALWFLELLAKEAGQLLGYQVVRRPLQAQNLTLR